MPYPSESGSILGGFYGVIQYVIQMFLYIYLFVGRIQNDSFERIIETPAGGYYALTYVYLVK